MFTFTIDYVLFVFVGSLGVIQVAASMGGLKGLLLLSSKVATRLVGLALPVGAAVWFFTGDTRNINDYDGGLDANAQALYFFFGALAATAATLLVSSIVNARMGDGGAVAQGEGLDALKSSNYVRALNRSLRYWGREWRTQIRPYFFG